MGSKLLSIQTICLALHSDTLDWTKAAAAQALAP